MSDAMPLHTALALRGNPDPASVATEPMLRRLEAVDPVRAELGKSDPARPARAKTDPAPEIRERTDPGRAAKGKSDPSRASAGQNATAGTRRDARYQVRLQIALEHLGQVQECITYDVSYRGLFVITDSPPPERHLVKVSLQVPNAGRLQAHAMVVRVVRPGAGAEAGAGLELFAVDRGTQQAWNMFVGSIPRLFPGADKHPVFSAPKAQVVDDPARRRYRRFDAVLEVLARDLGQLTTMYTQDISSGGMFLATQRPCKIGEELLLEVLHPMTGELFPVVGIVRRVVRDPATLWQGIAVELREADEQLCSKFRAFIAEDVPLGMPFLKAS